MSWFIGVHCRRNSEIAFEPQYFIKKISTIEKQILKSDSKNFKSHEMRSYELKMLLSNNTQQRQTTFFFCCFHDIFLRLNYACQSETSPRELRFFPPCSLCEQFHSSSVRFIVESLEFFLSSKLNSLLPLSTSTKRFVELWQPRGNARCLQIYYFVAFVD